MKKLKITQIKSLIALATLSLFTSCLEEPHPSIAQQGHFDAIGIQLDCENQAIKSTNQYAQSPQIQDTLYMTSNTKITCSVNFINSEFAKIAPPSDPQKSLSLNTGLKLTSQIEEWSFSLTSTNTGVDSVRIVLNHLSHADFKSPWITVITQEKTKN